MLYLANFSSYNHIYGSIGAIVALLMWFWFSSYAVMLGAALNAVMPRRGQ
jgi:membrane protein